MQNDSAELAQQEARNVDKWNQLNIQEHQSLESSVGTGEQVRLVAARNSISGGHSVHYVNLNDNVTNSTVDALHGKAPAEIAQEHKTEDGGIAWAAELGRIEPNYESNRDTLQSGGQVFGEPVSNFDTNVAVVPHVSTDGTPVLSYVSSVDGKNEFLVVSLEMSAYAEEMIHTENEGRISFIVRETGDGAQVVMDPSENAYFEDYSTKDINFSAVGTEGEHFSTEEPNDALASAVGGDYGNEPYIGATARVTEGSPFLVVVHTPESEAFGFVQDVQQYGIYASIGGILFVMLIGGVIGRNTSRSIDRLTTKAERMEEGDLDVEFETQRVDSIGRLYAGFANMRDSLKNQIQNAQNAREEAEQARAETEAINRHLEAKADEYRAVMQETAEGDLTARMDADTDNEAMEDIALEFNAMVAELEETTAGVKAFATDVATASEQVTASSEEVRSASEQVTESVQEISDGAERQNQSLQSVNHEMNGLSTTIEQIAASSNQVADIAERTAQTGKRGRDAAQDAIEGMAEIESESQSAVEEIERLEAEMEQIDELIEFITEVAEQTNMLALNANIEAARSGDSGEGFSVVAGEVKELAEETKTAAEDIEERLEAIQNQTEQTATEVQLTSDRVAEHTDSVQRAATALDEIADYAGETNVGVQEISAASEEQAASTQEVVSMVDEAATISEETTAESENVAAAAEEQTTALTEVSRSASDLANQAAQLSEALDRFDTEIGPGQVVDAETAVPVAGTDDPTPLPETGSEPSLEDESTSEPVDDASESLEDQRVDADETDDVERADDTASGEGQGDDDPSDVFTFGGEN
ncbi:methyl-accepting chemotaxis protein [Natronosalvus rutilus]|uniref:Methyl-accepting chemotaxis protein n=1 Tax=Natronosalvus rutilus TaxID=2953753 RepID=A0A9E7NBS6_9EURY|nr:methyl-accepting chemotaxis protein [Natronosalvus rutilus]UTF54068.1 methyl-accepting chemotaxis protein [Natronosalvus rutilus]